MFYKFGDKIMYVCICKNINEKKLKEEINNKKLQTVKEVIVETGAGSQCYKCIPEIREFLIKRK